MRCQACGWSYPAAVMGTRTIGGLCAPVHYATAVDPVEFWAAQLAAIIWQRRHPEDSSPWVLEKAA